MSETEVERLRLEREQAFQAELEAITKVAKEAEQRAKQVSLFCQSFHHF
jgi:hypothetical protein